jgi:CHAT domain-containing protein
VGVDRHRVTELYAAAGPDGEGSGSGYRLGQWLVLTARHVIMPAMGLTGAASCWSARLRCRSGCRPSRYGTTRTRTPPELPHARAEVGALARHYPGARTLTGPAATAGAVVAAVDGAGLVHVAAHGHFRADNPQFSSLRLHDGPLTAYDLECLDAAPHQVVLSACNSGRTPDLAGDEVLGLVAVFLALGTVTLIATVAPVPDGETASLMCDLHARLVRGAAPAVALAEAQQATGASGAALAASSGFVCFGAS